MVYFKRKDGSVFGKDNPSNDQMKAYKSDGCVECDKEGNVKKAKKGKSNAKKG
tara:strand:+ start:348 stop:506 length:159 start_codon:yes stop_codon:yes gene_type:complete